MAIDKVAFYACIRTKGLFQQLTTLQVQTIDTIFSECELQGITDIRQIAYIFATAAWEAYNPKHPESRLTPIKEFGGQQYLESKPYYPYFGRGLSQITWKANYEKEGKRLGIDLINNPDLMLDIPTACNSHVYCMAHGVYTGKKLSDYINDQKCDYVNSRRIINGTNKANDIAAIAQKFESCLQ